ncbi:gluconokinase [Sutcliffiella horikoshii]|uniref:gluconokinase n=1 Tax=Sutcliffiella horikoshii TaxID=79883 RepID=UPI00203D6840|nr:gluconokinase [Sutcliffiella horikoshii]MCM3619965.1 gluconokinase [Sutcliffiella horikoshii]
MGNYFIGLDIGTSTTKSVIFNKQGKAVSEFEVAYSTYHPKPGYSEQNPIEIDKAARLAISTSIRQKYINSSEVIGLSISSAMHSLICINDQGEPISPVIIWADGRSYPQAAIMKDSYGRDLYEQTGTPIHPMSPFVKLVWMKENQYTPYYEATRFVSIKEYILYKWSGTWQVDYSIASASGLLNIHTLQWDHEALAIAGINEAQLSPVVPCTEEVGPLLGNVAKELLLYSDTPIIIGSSDGVLANIGIGAIDEGETALTIGTSGAIRRFTNERTTDPEQRTFKYVFNKENFIAGGATNNGTVLMHWLARQFSTITKKETIEVADLEALAATSSAGANGLFFLPYLNGERAPKWNAKAKGGWMGLTLSHTSADMIRSVMESVIFNMFEIHEALHEKAGPTKKLIVSGEYSNSPLWVQMTADIFRKTVTLTESHQATAWGAAWLGLYSLGEVDSIEEIKHHIPIKHEVLPSVRNVARYEEYYHLYRELYNKNKPLFAEMDRLQY